MTGDVQVPDGDRDVEGVILAHLQYGNDDDPTRCGCGLVEPDEVYDANDAHVSAGWHAAHVAAMLRADLASQPASTVTDEADVCEQIATAIEDDDWFDPANIVHHVPEFREGIEYATARHARIARAGIGEADRG